MTYSFSLRWLSASALALTACNGAKSLGEYDTDDASGSDAGDGSGGDDGSGSASASASSSMTASGTSAATTDDSGTASDSDASASADTAGPDTGEESDTGSPGACEGEGNCVLYPIDCDVVQCGGTSVFDADGCVHTACTSDPAACGSGELCYRPMDFGGCQSSAVGCFDDESTMSCQCGTLPDCGGAYCLPEADWPAPDPGPGGGAHVRNDCAPDDGIAYELRFGLESSACGATPGAPFVSIRLDYIDPVPGTYLFGDFVGGQGNYDAGGGAFHTNGSGWVVIDAWDADSVTGTYHIVVPEVAYLSGDFDAPYCDAPALCG